MESSQDTVAALRKFSLFQELERHPGGLEELAALMKRETFEVRQPLISETLGDSRMYFLLSGQVEVNKMNEGGQVVPLGRVDARACPWFGESVLLCDYARSANVVAYTRCECLALRAKDLEGFLGRRPEVMASVYRNLAKLLFERLSKANKDIFIAGLSR